MGRLPELAVAVTTLGRVQGNITVLARQMECEEASVRAWLLRLRAAGEEVPYVEPPEPEVRLRTEIEKLRWDLDAALAHRNKLAEQLRENAARASEEITRLRRELDGARKSIEQKSVLLTEAADEQGNLKIDEVNARLRAENLEAQLRASERERAKHLESRELAEKELAAAREAEMKRAAMLNRQLRLAESAKQQHDRRRDDNALTTIQGTLDLAKEPLTHMDEEVARITKLVCDGLLQEANANGTGAVIQLWLDQHADGIRAAGRIFVRHVLVTRMGQKQGTTRKESVQDTYLYTLNLARSHSDRFPLGFHKWLQDGSGKPFVITLATALILSLDGKSSTDTSMVRQVRPRRPRQQKQPKTRTARAQLEPAAEVQRYEYPAVAPPPPKPLVSLGNVADPLVALMRDKVQLLDMLARYQEDRQEVVTGELLKPFTPGNLLLATHEAASEARQDYYFRPHTGMDNIELAWVIEGLELNSRAEEALYGEVLEEIEELKLAVEEVKPKRQKW